MNKSCNQEVCIPWRDLWSSLEGSSPAPQIHSWWVPREILGTGSGHYMSSLDTVGKQKSVSGERLKEKQGVEHSVGYMEIFVWILCTLACSIRKILISELFIRLVSLSTAIKYWYRLKLSTLSWYTHKLKCKLLSFYMIRKHNCRHYESGTLDRFHIFK